MKEFEQILDSLEKEYRHDLALHLYSTYLLHRVNPFLPVKHWTMWPLPTDRVPDPRTCHEYVDGAENTAWAPSVGIFGIVDSHKRKNEETETLNATERALKKAKVISNEAASHEKSAANSMSEESSDDEESSNGEEANRTIEEAARRDALAILNRESEESSSESESELESDLEITNNRKRTIPIVNLKVTQKQTDHRVNLLVETRALIHKKIRHRLSTMENMKGKDITLDFENDLTESMAKEMCTNIDGLLHALSGIVSPINKHGRGRKLFTWRNLLIANLGNPTSDSTNLETTQKAYDRCKDLFESFKFNYQYKYDVDDSDFSFEDYMERIKASRTKSPSLRNLADRVTKGRQQVSEESNIQDAIFKSLMKNKRRDLELSWNLGYKRGALKTKRKRDKSVVRVGQNTPQELIDKALEHNGVRLDASEYYMDI